MKEITLGSSAIQIPAIAVGCMRIGNMTNEEIVAMITHAVEMGVPFFDHADIYGKGVCEEKFGAAMKCVNLQREEIFLQTKCGIVPGKMYDCSKEHIIASVENSLRKLNTSYVDMLLLHRPDALIEPEEVAEAFELLEGQGKVRFFGVSNHNVMQINLLRKYLKQPIMVNQLQFGLGHSSMISAGMEVNMLTDGAIDRDGGVLDYCKLHDITVQAWSPFQSSKYKEVFLNSKNYPELNQKVNELVEKYGVSGTTIAVAWILRHPANIQVLSGTTNLSRFDEICKATEVYLTREEWYGLYLATGNILP